MNDTDSTITDCNISKYDDLMKNYMWDGWGDELGVALGSLKNEADEKIEKVIKGKETNYFLHHLPVEMGIDYEYSNTFQNYLIIQLNTFIFTLFSEDIDINDIR